MTRLHSYPLALVAVAMTTGCATSFLPKAIEPPAVFTLAGITPASSTPIKAPMALSQSIANKAPILIVSPPRASGGLNSTHILYVPRPSELAYFSQSQWVDSPSQMLMPLIAQAIQTTGAFKAVLSTPSGALSQYRMDTEIVKLEQNFIAKPSEVQFVLRAVIINTATRNVIAQKDFTASVVATSDDAYGGVVAAQKAVQVVLEDLATFCAAAVKP